MIRRLLTIAPLALVLITTAALAAGCSGTASTGGGGDGSAEAVEVCIFVRGALPEVADSFVLGQEVRVKDTATVVGEITGVEITPSLMPVPTAEGELRAAESPVFMDVELTIRGEAVVSDSGYSFGGTNLYINNDIKYLTPYTLFGGVITSIEVVGD